jgi:hypothetical protein
MNESNYISREHCSIFVALFSEAMRIPLKPSLFQSIIGVLLLKGLFGGILIYGTLSQTA